MNIYAETPYLAKFWFLNYWSKCSRLLKLHDPFKHNILESKGDEIDFLHANNVFCKLIVSFFCGCGWACLDMPKGHRIIKRTSQEWFVGLLDFLDVVGPPSMFLYTQSTQNNKFAIS